jgi:hypothetical protein
MENWGGGTKRGFQPRITQIPWLGKNYAAWAWNDQKQLQDG